jgi:hypothetical protein
VHGGAFPAARYVRDGDRTRRGARDDLIRGVVDEFHRALEAFVMGDSDAHSGADCTTGGTMRLFRSLLGVTMAVLKKA